MGGHRAPGRSLNSQEADARNLREQCSLQHLLLTARHLQVGANFPACSSAVSQAESFCQGTIENMDHGNEVSCRRAASRWLPTLSSALVHGSQRAKELGRLTRTLVPGMRIPLPGRTLDYSAK